ncbi:hypothetical protein [Nocardia africana]
MRIQALSLSVEENIMELRSAIGYRLRTWADRIDYKGAPRRLTSYTFTFEDGEGIRFREDGRGCRLWYLGDADYDKAHDESDSEQRRRERDESIARTLESMGEAGRRIRESFEKVARGER